MSENAKPLIDSLCKSCSFLSKFIVGNGNMWFAVCDKKGTVLPRKECDDYEMEG